MGGELGEHQVLARAGADLGGAHAVDADRGFQDLVQRAGQRGWNERTGRTGVPCQGTQFVCAATHADDVHFTLRSLNVDLHEAATVRRHLPAVATQECAQLVDWLDWCRVVGRHCTKD